MRRGTCKVDAQPDPGYILTLRDGKLSCRWQGACDPTTPVVRSIRNEWFAQMPGATERVLQGTDPQRSTVVLPLLLLDAFLLWARLEALKIAVIECAAQKLTALEKFEYWLERFDRLPDMIKAKAVDFADPYNPFNPANYPDPGLSVVLPDPGRNGHWVARKAGEMEPTGEGEDQGRALQDLESKVNTEDGETTG